MMNSTNLVWGLWEFGNRLATFMWTQYWISLYFKKVTQNRMLHFQKKNFKRYPENYFQGTYKYIRKEHLVGKLLTIHDFFPIHICNISIIYHTEQICTMTANRYNILAISVHYLQHRVGWEIIIEGTQVTLW